jgi:hypothetical protein
MESRSEVCTRRSSRARAGALALLLGLAFFSLVLAGPGARPALADAGGTSASRDKVQTELDRTDQVLERAQETVRTCSDAKAAAYLEEAQAEQRKARDLLVSGTPGGGPKLALSLTLSARNLAVKAIELCVQPVATDALRELLDSTQDLVHDASSAVNASGNPAARRLFEAGLSQLDKAREAYGNKDLRRALSLGAAARNLVRRALQRAQEGASGGSVETAESALDRTDLLISEVRSAQGSDQTKVEAILERAQKEQDQARRSLTDGQADPAMRWTVKARSSALEALWLVQQTPDAERLRSALEVVEGSLRESGPGIRASGVEEAVRLLEKAQEQADAARQDLAKGETERAVQSMRLADSLLRRAMEKSGR